MDASTLWWLLALALGMAELFTGTIFLVMIALGCALAGLAAFMGLGLTWQLLAAAAGALAGAVWLRARNRSRARVVPADQDPQINLDIGARLQIGQWLSARRTEVRYRGATWQVELTPESADGQPGEHEIRRVSGNTLIVRALPVQH